MIPARSTTTSPSAASASGVAVRTVASRNAVAGALIASRRRSRPTAHASERDERENDARFDDRDDDRRNARVALHRRRSRLERAEQNAGHDHAARVQSREQRDGDRRVAVSGRDVLVERVRHAGTSIAPARPASAPLDEKRARRHAVDVDLSRRSRRVRIRADRAQTESAAVANRPTSRRRTRQPRSTKPEMQSRRSGRSAASCALRAIVAVCG